MKNLVLSHDCVALSGGGEGLLLAIVAGDGEGGSVERSGIHLHA